VADGHAGREERPVVAHINQLFFLSTQSFIYAYLSHLERFRPVCLTRAPESTAIRRDPPAAMAHIFHRYGTANGVGQGHAWLWSLGLEARRRITRLPPSLAGPLLDSLNAHVVPHLRTDNDPDRYLAWVEGIVRREDARILHAYFAPLGWRLLALKRELGLPLVVTLLGDDVGPAIGSWWWWLIHSGPGEPDWPARLCELFEQADLFLAEGPFLRDRLIELGCPPQKVRVQRMAVPVRTMKPRGAAENVCGKPFIILFAGRFCEQKGLLHALDAVRRVSSHGRAVEFRIIGDETLTDGHYASHVYAFIRAHGLRDRVRLLGFLNHDDYLKELRQADVFLHPSITDDKGLGEGGAPTTILEAQALAVPVISTWHCDIPHVTIPGESALLVPERDGAALADALCRLQDDPLLRSRMGRAGRRLIEARHDIEREVPALEDCYEMVLEGRQCALTGGLPASR
jgi:colanic acid/amylovoran biosynthesis glycosyltransferase